MNKPVLAQFLGYAFGTSITKVLPYSTKILPTTTKNGCYC